MGDDNVTKVPVVFGGHDNSLFSCPLANCAYTTVSAANVKSHFRTRHRDRKGAVHFESVCSRCSFKVTAVSTRGIEAHWLGCGSLTGNSAAATRADHDCQHCERTFFHRLALKKHLKEAHTGNSSPNTHTPNNGPTPYLLRVAYDGPERGVSLVCPACKERGRVRDYSTLSRLKDHMKDQHDATCSLMVTCGLCGVARPAADLRSMAAHYKACLKNTMPFSAVRDTSLLAYVSTDTTPLISLPGTPVQREKGITLTPHRGEKSSDVKCPGSSRRDTSVGMPDPLKTTSVPTTPPVVDTENTSPQSPQNNMTSEHTNNTNRTCPRDILITSTPKNNHTPSITKATHSSHTKQASSPNTNISPEQINTPTNEHHITEPNTPSQTSNANHTQNPNGTYTQQHTSQSFSRDYSFVPGELQEAQRSLTYLLDDIEGQNSPFELLEKGFTQWCECATDGFAKKRHLSGNYNAGAKARSLWNRKEPRGVGQKRTRYRKNVALRKAFNRDQKGTVRKILEGKDSERRCPIGGTKLGELFGETYSLPVEQRRRKPLPKWMHSSSNQPGPRFDQNNDPITAGEVVSAIKSRDLASSPGTDGLTYAFWKSLDPQGKLLARLFELCRVRGRIFSSWRKSRVTLICKDPQGDLHSMRNWRPIAVCHTVYRLYTTVMARRVTKWASEEKIISSEQKGFMPAEGVFEHIFMLDETVADAKMSKKSLWVTWLDIRNAFGSVRPDCILQVLEHFRAPAYMLEVVADLYRSGSFSLRGGDGASVEVATEKGVRQGCPLSGILFNIVLEVLLRGIQDSTDGYNMGWKRGRFMQCLAYADDVCILTSTRKQMVRQLQRCEEFANWAGFEFNNEKSACMLVDPRKSVARSRPLPFCNGEVGVMSRDRFYKYLGAKSGYRLPCTDAALVSRKEDEVVKLFNSPLLPQQKVQALKRFIIPSVRFHLRVRPFTQKSLVQLDRTIRQCVRAAYRLPGNSCTSFFHAPCPKGGLGIPSLAVEADVLTVAHVFKMLSSPDGRVRDTATDRLERVTARTRPGATREDMAAHLSGLRPGETQVRQNSNSGAPRDLLSRVTRASRRLRVEFKAMEDSSFAVGFRDNLILSEGRRSITKALHQYQNLVWFERWSGSPSQGKSATSLAQYSCSNHWISHPGELSPGAESFCFKARLSLLPTLNVVQRFNKGPRPVPYSFVCCRGCGSAEESLGHVLNVCRPSMDLQLERHDAIQQLLLDSIPKNKFRTINVDRVNPHHQELGGRDLRPDIVAEANDSFVVLDVTCPYVNGPTSLQKAAERKIAKYETLCTDICQRTGKNVQFFPFVVGSLGSYAGGNNSAMEALGIPRKIQTGLRKLVVKAAINGSQKIWNRFIQKVYADRERRIEANATARRKETTAYTSKRNKVVVPT